MPSRVFWGCDASDTRRSGAATSASIPSMRTMGRLLSYLRPYAARMVAAAIMLAIGGALMAAVISTVKPLVNGWKPKARRRAMPQLH